MTDAAHSLLTELHQQTARLPWSELQRHFARGVALVVDSDLDLIDIAASFIRDDKDAVAALLASRQVAAASDEQALRWHQQGSELWAVVAAPWVLVQESEGKRPAG